MKRKTATIGISNAQLARIEKNLRSAAELGSALAALAREILTDVRSAERAIVAHRQSELPLSNTADAERSERYEVNTKKLLDVFERPSHGKPVAEQPPTGPTKKPRRARAAR